MEADKGKQIMAKEKKQKQINLEEITALTKELFHAHYAGDLERWFDYLCPDSIYLGTGEPMLFGGSAIREHFKGFEGEAADVVSEEYYPVPLGETAAQVCGLDLGEDQEGDNDRHQRIGEGHGSRQAQPHRRRQN